MEDDILELIDEEGEVHQFRIIDLFALDDREYIVLQLVDKDDDAIILRIEENSEGETFVTIDDDGEWERVEEAWNERNADEDDEEDY